jgi:hypothetical protein
MLLAHRVWEEVAEGEEAALAEWTRAFERTLLDLEPEFDARWQRLSVTEQKAVRAVLAGGGSPYRERVLGRLDLSKSSAQQALKNLAARAEVETARRRYAPVDPLFALWIERLAQPVEPEGDSES